MMAAKNIQVIKLSNRERILNLLKKNPEHEYTYGDIAEALNISKTNIGKTINPLVKEGKVSVIKIGHKKFVSIESSSDNQSSDQSSSDLFSQKSQKENNILKRTPLEENIEKDNSDQSSSNQNSSDQSSSDQTHEIQKIPTISDLREQETISYIKGMKDELKIHGRVIPLNKKQEIANWIHENKPDLIDALSTSLSAYRKYKNPKNMRQKKRWREQMKFLEGL